MQIKPIKPEQITFNPATEHFEALITVKTTQGTYRYPCAVPGAITTPPAGATFKLVQQAKQRHQDRGDLCASVLLAASPAQSEHAA